MVSVKKTNKQKELLCLWRNDTTINMNVEHVMTLLKSTVWSKNATEIEKVPDINNMWPKKCVSFIFYVCNKRLRSIFLIVLCSPRLDLLDQKYSKNSIL